MPRALLLALTLCLAAHAGAAPLPPYDVVVVASGDAASTASRLVAVTPGGEGARRVVATIDHQPGVGVYGRAAGRDRYVVTTQVDAARDTSWASSLLVVESGVVRRLADGLAHASAPVVVDDDHVLIARGAADRTLPTGEIVDRVTVDEVDLGSGMVKSLYHATATLAFPVGRLDGDTVIVEVAHGKTTLLTIGSQGARRVVADELRLGRDFFLLPERRSVVAQIRGDNPALPWELIEIRLDDGARHRIVQLATYAIAAAPWSQPSLIAFNPGGENGLRLLDLDGRRVTVGAPQLAPSAEVGARSLDGRFIAVVPFATRGRSVAPLLVDGERGTVWPIVLAADVRRVELVGVVAK